MADAKQDTPGGSEPTLVAPRCPDCGDAVPCGAQAGKDRCWCMAYEPLAPAPELPEDACLCEPCLRKRLAAQGDA